jgi:hypothetical protein
MLKGLVDRMKGVKEESEVSPGMLYSTGLVAGGSLTGVLIAILSGIPMTHMVDGVAKEVSLMTVVQDAIGIHGFENLGAGADLIGALFFFALGFLLFKTAMKKD